ncbi:MAG: [Fe-Fe] hydrogenase large subunit C-terminal domain-containing protein [Limnochordia bacterium]
MWTNVANCHDCYACVRACPVKAIRVNVGHAEVVEELCILDGACVAACPQGAKQVEQHGERVEAYLAQGRVAFSLAPSLAAAFTSEPGVVAAALRRLGAHAVAETSEVTRWVSQRHWERAEALGSVISSCCPAVVNLITHYYPGVLPHLADVVSPMIAHGRTAKRVLGADTRVVFVGPCIAKKKEMRERGLSGAVDAVLTFAELKEFLTRLLPQWEELEPEPFDTFVASVSANEVADQRRFPLPGGMVPLLANGADPEDNDVLVVTGITQCAELLTDIPCHGMPAKMVELMACDEGCVGGPGVESDIPVYRRARKVRAYARHSLPRRPMGSVKYGEVDLTRGYEDQRLHLPQPSEEEVRAILASIGKREPEDELNCGACGYDSCREKAVAVYQGMAEREMCIPYMRRKAESMADVTIAATPTGIVVVNRELHVLAFNPAAERIWGCQAAEHVGRPLWRLGDPSRVESVFARQASASAVVRLEKQDRVIREHLVYDSKNDLVIIMLSDITEETKRQEHFADLKEASLERAQEVIDKQMRVAQEIAGLLGETTAETKAILTQLMELFQGSGGRS